MIQNLNMNFSIKNLSKEPDNDELLNALLEQFHIETFNLFKNNNYNVLMLTVFPDNEKEDLYNCDILIEKLI